MHGMILDSQLILANSVQSLRVNMMFTWRLMIRKRPNQ